MFSHVSSLTPFWDAMAEHLVPPKKLDVSQVFLHWCLCPVVIGTSPAAFCCNWWQAFASNLQEALQDAAELISDDDAPAFRASVIRDGRHQFTSEEAMKVMGRAVGSIMPWKANMTCSLDLKKRCGYWGWKVKASVQYFCNFLVAQR